GEAAWSLRRWSRCLNAANCSASRMGPVSFMRVRYSKRPRREKMIRLQIVERPGSRLFSVLKKSIRSKDLRTFSLEKAAKRVVHIRSPGYMNWVEAEGVIACEIRTPKDEGKEWQLLAAVIGRLADRFPGLVESINIQLTAPPPEPKKRRRRRAK